MRKAVLKIALLAGTALCLALPQAVLAQAQDADQALAADEGDDNPADIIVTARRVEERLQDVPISITVFSQAQISNRNIVQPSDLVAYTPSLAINNRFGAEKATFAIRGFNQDAGTQPSVGVYFADVVAPRASGSTASGNGATAGSLFDLQNIQVLKGPQGTLFGRNTTGGAVLLVPQRPTGELEGYVEGSIGNYDLRRGLAVLNIPLADTFKVRLGVDRMKREGYLRNRSGIGPKDFNDVNYIAARLSVLAELTPELENYTIFSYSKSETNGNLPKLTDCRRQPGPGPTLTGNQTVFAPLGCAQIDRAIARGDGFYDVENSVPNPFINLKQWQVINTTTWEASDLVTVKNIVSYGEFAERSRFNINGDNLFTDGRPVFTGPGLPIHFATVAPGPSGWTSHQSTLTEELQLQGRSADDRLTYQIGGYLERSDPLSRSMQSTDTFMNCTDVGAFECTSPNVPATRGRVSTTDFSFKYRNWALYAQATYKLSDQFSVTGGLRYTNDKIIGTAQSYYALYTTPNTPSFFCTKVFSAPGVNLPLSSPAARTDCFEQTVQKSAKPTWMIDVDYKPNDDVLFYAKYARGYRQGSLNLIPTGEQFQRVGPEKVDLYEVGVKTTLRGPVSGTFNATAFWNEFSNQQIVASLVARPGQGVGGVVPVNAGKSRIRGFEVESSLNLFEGLRLDASYAYLDAYIISIDKLMLTPADIYSSINYTADAGQRLTYTPKHKLSVTATYTLPLDESLGDVSLGATYTYTGSQFATHADDLLAGYFGYNPGLAPATNLVNLNLNWNEVAGGPVDVALFVTNVTNEKYRIGTTGSFGSMGWETQILGQPRMYGARLKVRFGS